MGSKAYLHDILNQDIHSIKLNSIQKIIPEAMIVKNILILFDKDIATIECKILFFGQIRI